MARARSPDRDKAFQLWRDSGGTMLLKDIAAALNVPDSRIRKWKTEGKWNEQIKERSDSGKGALLYSNRSAPKSSGAPLGNKNAIGHGAPKGNKNAVGNHGGPGGPPGNKKAVVTGEYETIWYDCLSDEEQALVHQINTDHRVQIEEEIRMITLRERRILQHIKKLTEGLPEKQRKVLQERQVVKEPMTIHNEVKCETKTVLVGVPSLVIKSIEETEYRKIEDILRLEDALTRIQDKKAKLLSLRHEFDKGKPPENSNIEDYVKALSGAAEEAWAGNEDIKEPGEPT